MNMEIKKPDSSFDLWRKLIIRTLFIIVGMIFVVEAVVFFAFRSNGLLDEGFTEHQYILKYILLPTLLCAVAVVIAQRFNAMNVKRQVKNYAVVLTVSVLAYIIAYIHADIGAILTVFTIPIFLTVLFGSRRMTGVIAIANGILMFLSALRTATYINSVYIYLNAAVAIALMLAAYLISMILIAYNKENIEYIFTSYQTQLSLHEQARIDSLTGLYNQKTFQSLLKGNLEKARRTKSTVSLAIIDLDGFKEINDTFGHLEGDQVLIHFTDLIKQHCSDSEAVLSRYGGDEFAVIFPRVSKESAFKRLEGLRHSCRQVTSTKIRSGMISFSAGIAHFSGGDMNETLLFHQADSALYQAKQNGKDQTVIYQD
jgi:diguanylate cyclase (GGDEF)-like protein